MSGVRLESRVHIVTGAVTSAQNIVKCAQRCGLIYGCGYRPEQLASSEAVLSQDEKDLGVALIDIGGGTTDIAIWSEGSIIHTSVLPVGGDHITSDIAVGLRTPMDDVEEIKQKYGCASANLVDDEENIEVPSVGGRKPRTLSKRILTEIIEPRVEEMFTLCNKKYSELGTKIYSHQVLSSPGALPCWRAWPSSRKTFLGFSAIGRTDESWWFGGRCKKSAICNWCRAGFLRS